MADGLVEKVRAALAQPEDHDLEDQIGHLRPSAWASLIARLSRPEMPLALDRLPEALIPEVLAELDARLAGEIVSRLPPWKTAAWLEQMNPDDATDVIAQLSADLAEQILDEMDAVRAADLRRLMTYPPDSAGGRMTSAFVAVSPQRRADQAISSIREVAATAETIYYVYIVDSDQVFLGVLSLRDLMLAHPDTLVVDLMEPETVSVRVDTDQEEAARLLILRNLLAIPVLDLDGRLVGIITEDDVADVLEEEATEDIERLGGSQALAMSYRQATISLLFRKRIVWLLVLFVAEAYTGSVMRYFEDTLEQAVALAFFIPLLLGTGGNIGSQITTTLVRAMAVENFTLRDMRWILGKEFRVGLIIGGVMAIVAFARAEILGVGSDVAMVVALTIAVICLWSSIVAAVLPLLLRKLRFDPTVVSAPFITTLVDGTGLVIYFMIAKFLLGL